MKQLYHLNKNHTTKYPRQFDLFCLTFGSFLEQIRSAFLPRPASVETLTDYVPKGVP